MILNSKDKELYIHIYNQLFISIKYHNAFDNYNDIKIMTDFELSLRKSIKKCFKGCILQGSFFHFCKKIEKNQKPNFFKKI